ncbi:MAG TPA: COR domain-containing protein [Urbifossiella sp.]|nr:COR domain-containing protein [Urbifossiella sp.]
MARRSGARVLYLTHNNLTDVPESLGQLTWLRSLNLSHNELTAVPESLRQLTQLQELFFQSNRLKAVPASLGQLTQLHDLYLNNNDLTALPESLGQLTRLQTLNLSGNDLTALPVSLGQLTQLQKLDLAGNPLNPELRAARDQGLHAILAYLRANEAGPTVVLNEAKLVLVGEGGVGKSCLLAALRGDPWVENRDTTHGIELKPVPVTDPDSGTALTLNGWDFGGQDVYKPTHQLFFSTPAVYLVVWKPREGQQAGAIDEWIKLVTHRAPGAKVLVVATHGGAKARQPDIDRQALWDRFGKDTIVGFYHVDSHPPEGVPAGEGEGVAALKAEIARVAARLPGVGRTVPKSWQDARTALKSTGKPYLPLTEVLGVCKQCKMDDAGAALFVTLSHQLGHLIHYDHDPELRDVVVLKPDWLATAISYVLDDKQTRAGNGLVDDDRLAHLWTDPARPPECHYDSRCHNVFRRLMERFDLSYRIVRPPGAKPAKPAKQTSLIAQLVPDVRDEAALARAWPPSPRSGQTQQTQLCQVVDLRNRSAAAEGLLFQLIVRLHRYSLGRADHDKSVHWRRGVVLEDTYGSRALLDHVDNDIRVTVRSPFPERFLTVLTEQVKELVESFWDGLRCVVAVPCLNPLGLNPPCHGTFEVADLLEDSQRHNDNAKCPGCKQRQNIHQLLRNATAARPDPLGELVLSELIAMRGELKTLGEYATARQDVLIGRFDQAAAAADARGKEVLSKMAARYDELLRAFADEAKDGPRLFSLEPVKPGFLDRPKWVSEKFRVTLWCEHARLPLPELNKRFDPSGDPKRGVYTVTVPREWFTKAAAVLKPIATTLSVVLPVAGPLAKVTLDAAEFGAIEKQLDLAVKAVDSVCKGFDKAEPWLGDNTAPEVDRGAGVGRDSPARAAGAELRQLHAWLKEKDPGFGGLVRVSAKGRGFLWVHPRYAGEY